MNRRRRRRHNEPVSARTLHARQPAQWFVNHAPNVLDEAIGLGRVDWRSPLRDDGYAEYRDAGFLERLGVTLPRRPLDTFWPRGGPQWDALGRAASGEAVIVEAKAHLNELYSPATGAAESSLATIRASLAEAARSMGVADGFDWSKQFYQYANRLAHAYFFEQVNGVPVKLVFVYFTGDADMKGPAMRDEWLALPGSIRSMPRWGCAACRPSCATCSSTLASARRQADATGRQPS